MSTAESPQKVLKLVHDTNISLYYSMGKFSKQIDKVYIMYVQFTHIQTSTYNVFALSIQADRPEQDHMSQNVALMFAIHSTILTLVLLNKLRCHTHF